MSLGISSPIFPVAVRVAIGGIAMSSYSPINSPSKQTLAWARGFIIFAVLLTAFASALIVQLRLQDYQINPDQIPIANMNIWKALND